MGERMSELLRDGATPSDAMESTPGIARDYPSMTSGDLAVSLPRRLRYWSIVLSYDWRYLSIDVVISVHD